MDNSNKSNYFDDITIDIFSNSSQNNNYYLNHINSKSKDFLPQKYDSKLNNRFLFQKNKEYDLDFYYNENHIIYNLSNQIIYDKNNQYKIIKILGSNESLHGIVYLALELNTNKLFAIKILKKISYSQREIDCLKFVKKVCGKNILCYVDDFIKKINSVSYSLIVMEYNENMVELENYINYNIKKQTPLNIKELNQILYQVADALKLLSSIGISHNDLHLGNILINVNDKTIKIIDFGSSSYDDIETASIKNNKSFSNLYNLIYSSTN
jgi:serine/threonine protein kinase